ncbi:MAG: hypothetical protein EA387_04530 [Nitriliruptor sp.]|nr:MAG: hypothetical protein EA387_04530 [Nitriliruptor sp.]
MTIRPLEPEETGRFRAVARRSFGLMDSVGFSTEGDRVLAAVDGDGEVVGGTVLRTFTTAGRTIGVIDWVFADPEKAPRGTGGALRDAALAWFDAVGADELFASIEPLNTASEALHRAGGFAPLPWRAQARRWGWRLPEVQLRSHLTPYGTNERPWVRPAESDQRWWRPRTWWTATLPLNVALLVIVSIRAPLTLTIDLSGLLWIAGVGAALLGVREGLVRLVARALGQRQPLLHVPWTNGVPVSGLFAVALGIWVPLTGSSVPAAGGTWRLDRETRWMLPAQLVGGLAVAAVAWTLLLLGPSTGVVPWSDVARAATMLAFLDLVVPADHFVGTTSRLAWRHSPVTWALVAAIGAGPAILAWLG